MATNYIVKKKSPLIDFTNELIDKKISPIEVTVEKLQKRVEEGGTSGGVSSWNDLTDKPFGEEGIAPIAWDGNTEGRDACTVEDSSFSLYKVDDRVFTVDQLDGATLFMSYNGTESSQPITKDMCFGNDSTVVCGEMMVMSSSVTGEVSITSASGNMSLSAVLNIPSTGTYFVDMSSMGLIMTRVEFPAQLKQLDEKYIPDTIARVSDIPAEASEDEFIEFLNDISIVEPLASASGEIYTTNNNELYIL
jgi:hypothetical protein